MSRKRTVEICIPARIGSVRLPRKALIQVNGKSILQWTYESASRLGLPVTVITEDSEIADEVNRFGGNVFVGKGHVTSGTEGIKQYVQLMQIAWQNNQRANYVDGIVNIQGDTPVFDGALVQTIIKKMNFYKRSVVTGYYEVDADDAKYHDHKYVKIAMGSHPMAAYFSRQNIPTYAKRRKIHIGIYGYNAWDLAKTEFAENEENLEQHNFIINGTKVVCVEGQPSISIDTAEDLKIFQEYLDAT